MRQGITKWLIVSILGVLAMVYGGVAGVKVSRYLRLSEPLEVEVDHWSVRKVGSDLYHIEVEAGEFHGLLSQYLFRNEYAAAAKAETLDRVTVWHAPNELASHTFDRRFPFKVCVYSLVMLGLTVYGYRFPLRPLAD